VKRPAFTFSLYVCAYSYHGVYTLFPRLQFGKIRLEGIAMDLIYLIAIVAFGALVTALAIGCDKLHRAPGGRP
jgi:hypothetical protein